MDDLGDKTWTICKFMTDYGVAKELRNLTSRDKEHFLLKFIDADYATDDL